MIVQPEHLPPDDTPDGASPAGDDGGERRQSYSIGALAREFKITTRAIRFYETRGLLAPARQGTTRVFSRRDRARLALILRGKNLGFSLEDIAEYLALYDADPGQVAQTRLLLEKVEAHIADMQGKKADLEHSIRELKEIRAQCREHIRSARRTRSDD